MRKKYFIFIILILLILVGGVFWWWQSGKKITEEKGTEEKPSVTETTMTLGKVIPPKGISPESFEIIGLMTTTTPDIQGNFSGRIYKEGVTAITAMPKSGKGHELQAIVIASEGKPEKFLTLDLNTTAIAIVFETPFLITNDPDQAREILKVIENDPKVKEFAKVIENVFNEEDFLDDPIYQQAFKEAIESVLNTLNP